MTKTPRLHLLRVEGMTCQHCVKAVTRAVQDQDPDAKVSVDLTQARVSVDTVLDAAQVIQAIVDEGYAATPQVS